MSNTDTIRDGYFVSIRGALKIAVADKQASGLTKTWCAEALKDLTALSALGQQTSPSPSVDQIMDVVKAVNRDAFFGKFSTGDEAWYDEIEDRLSALMGQTGEGGGDASADTGPGDPRVPSSLQSDQPSVAATPPIAE